MDKTSKKILKKMNEICSSTNYIYGFSSGFGDCSIDDLALAVGIDTEDCRSDIRFLKELGYVEYKSTQSGIYVGFHLSHKGLHHSEFKRIDFKKYLADKWIDFLALVVAAIALIISIVAIAKP